MVGRGSESEWQRERERVCAYVNHNQLLNIITAESEANLNVSIGHRKQNYHEGRRAQASQQVCLMKLIATKKPW